MHVLLLEPDTKLANTYSSALKAAGHSVAWSSHAQNAVHTADEKSPDVVVLELQLAGHNGIEFMYEFRSYTEWVDVPIVLLTMVPPHSLNLTKEMMKEFSIVDCLYKPATNLQQLVHAVEDAS